MRGRQASDLGPWLGAPIVRSKNLRHASQAVWQQMLWKPHKGPKPKGYEIWTKENLIFRCSALLGHFFANLGDALFSDFWLFSPCLLVWASSFSSMGCLARCRFGCGCFPWHSPPPSPKPPPLPPSEKGLPTSVGRSRMSGRTSGTFRPALGAQVLALFHSQIQQNRSSKMSGKTHGSPRHPSTRHPRTA